MKSKPNFYEVLEVDIDSTKEELLKKRNELLHRWHSDKGDKSQEANEKTILIIDAYKVLSDDEKRKIYDESMLSDKMSSSEEEIFNQWHQDASEYWANNAKEILLNVFDITHPGWKELNETLRRMTEDSTAFWEGKKKLKDLMNY